MDKNKVFARDAAGRPTQVWDGDRLVSAERAKQTDSGNARAQSAKAELWNKLNKIDNFLLLTGASDYCFATTGKDNKTAQRIHKQVAMAQSHIAEALRLLR